MKKGIKFDNIPLDIVSPAPGLILHSDQGGNTDDCIFGLLQQQEHEGKAKGLAARFTQTASPFGYLNNFYFEIWSNLLESLQGKPGLLMRMLSHGCCR
jgi:hypothetical protein